MKRNIMLLLCGAALTASAQTDVTADYLTHYDFDSGFHHKAGATTEVKQEIKTITGWTAGFTVDYTITGIYEYGFAGTFNGGEVPSKGYQNSEGGALALSTGWGVAMTYSQNVTLPAGTYTINVPTYNGKSATKGRSQLAWIPQNGTAVISTLNGYPSKTWSLDQISFTLTESTRGKIQIGYTAAENTGSGSSANLLIDYVQILVQSMDDSKAELNKTLQKANALYADGSGRGADDLKTAIDRAQAAYDGSETPLSEVLAADEALKEAIETYRWWNASPSTPFDCTDRYLQNPSFEVDGTAGWTVLGMSSQTNSYFTKKDGTYYMEAWVSRGSKISDASLSQVLKGLPKGNYRLLANALHIQQSGQGSVTNTGAAQKGAYLYAGLTKTLVTAMKTYHVDFSVVEEQGEIEVGVQTEDPTGNYLCVDNFQLQYIGEVGTSDIVKELQSLVTQAEDDASNVMQQTAADGLNQAIDEARQALAGTGTGEDNKPIYDENALNEAYAALTAAMTAAKESVARYTSLQERITYADKVLAWWKDMPRKATAWGVLDQTVATAKEQVKDCTLTDDQLAAATNSLNTRIKAVDKKIYCSGSACGSDAKLQDNNNQWSYKRSYQSKHWVLFWEKEYGDEVPSAVPGILETADKIFEVYADKLGFITINQGKSKSDTYKMIIRLYSTSEWKAEGSGIDNQIGMLSLSRWAYTSRGGQTVAHEIGHCFQYQVHCDNGDWNGWMYNWHESTVNPFWEMCAQWMAYVYYPGKLLNDNEWLWNSLNGMHRHPLAGYLRYENFFIQDLFVHKHGWDAVGRLWNDCRDPEDPFETYMRTRMTGTTSQKVSQLGDELWEWGARMTTFDLDPIRSIGDGKASWRSQTALTKDDDGYWWPEKKDCIENYGNNAIRLNAPSKAKTLYVEFEGKAGADGYTAKNITRAGWRIGFVAFKSDGTRVYGDMHRAGYNDADQLIAFDCPAGCSHVWLVISGAPSTYWTHNFTGWIDNTEEQWPYRVRFYQTNVYGEANNDDVPTGVEGVEDTEALRREDFAIHDLSGRRLGQGAPALRSLRHGIYVVGGKKVAK